MKGFVLATVSAIALSLGGAGAAHAWGYSGTTAGPQGPTYYPNYSSYGVYTPAPRYIPTPEYSRYAGTGYRLRRSLIVRAQLALRRDGLYHGNIDGLIGPETREALADFQRQQGLPVTYALNPATMASLGIGAVSQGSGSPGAGMPPYAGR